MWEQLLQSVQARVEDEAQAYAERPYEAIINIIREMSQKLSGYEVVFSPNILVPLVETYAVEHAHPGPINWVPDLFISVSFDYDTIINILEGMFYNEVNPFVGPNRIILANHIVYVAEQWYMDCMRHNKRIFGGDVQKDQIGQILAELAAAAYRDDAMGRQRVMDLRRKIGLGALR